MVDVLKCWYISNEWIKFNFQLPSHTFEISRGMRPAFSFKCKASTQPTELSLWPKSGTIKDVIHLPIVNTDQLCARQALSLLLWALFLVFPIFLLEGRISATIWWWKLPTVGTASCLSGSYSANFLMDGSMIGSE